MAKSVAVLHCKRDGIKALVDKYANILDIDHQVLASEMELFSSTDNEITFDVIQKELTENVNPQYYRTVQLALTLPVVQQLPRGVFQLCDASKTDWDQLWGRNAFLRWLC